ncbi:MAG: hypothetical protein ACTSXJ_08595 [Candidatus Baldrarchaeia archaeon]
MSRGRVFVECKPDVCLVKKLIAIPRRKLQHVGGKGRIRRIMERSENLMGDYRRRSV